MHLLIIFQCWINYDCVIAEWNKESAAFKKKEQKRVTVVEHTSVLLIFVYISVIFLSCPTSCCSLFFRGSSWTSTWPSQPSTRVNSLKSLVHYTCFLIILLVCHVFIIVACYFVEVLGVLALQYLKTMPLQLTNRLKAEIFYSSVNSDSL